MDCNQMHYTLDSGWLDAPTPEMLEHLKTCADCRSVWSRARASLSVLRGLPEPPVPAGYADRVLGFTRAAAYYHRRREHSAWAWGLGIAAALLIGISIGVGLAGRPESDYQVRNGIVMVRVGAVTNVHLALDAGHPIQDVGFVINVPDGMELQGHPGERQIEWTGDLAQGRNILNLPLIAKAGATGTLEADLHFAGRENTLKVQVRAVENSALQGFIHRLWARMNLG